MFGCKQYRSPEVAARNAVKRPSEEAPKGNIAIGRLSTRLTLAQRGNIFILVGQEAHTSEASGAAGNRDKKG